MSGRLIARVDQLPGCRIFWLSFNTFGICARFDELSCLKGLSYLLFELEFLLRFSVLVADASLQHRASLEAKLQQSLQIEMDAMYQRTEELDARLQHTIRSEIESVKSSVSFNEEKVPTVQLCTNTIYKNTEM